MGRAAEYGEHREQRSQEISAEQWHCQEISGQTQELPGNLKRIHKEEKMLPNKETIMKPMDH
jgi:hypothetical protein